MLASPGPVTLRFQNRTIVRAHGFAYLDEITCPDGHKLSMHSFRIYEDGAVTCSHRAHKGAPECGARLWMLYVPGRGRRKRWYVCDVELSDLDLWERHTAEVDEILAYIGATFPNRKPRAA